MAKDGIEFITHHDSFREILGSDPSASLLAESENGTALYHEACIYDKKTRSVFVTSNQIPNDGDAHTATGKHVVLWQIFIEGDVSERTIEKAKCVDVTGDAFVTSFLNGGVNLDEDSILMCAQGGPDLNTLSGLVRMEMSPPHQTTTLISTFHSIPFNSVNDVIVHPVDKSIWFTDPCYGYAQKFRPTPQLPNQVYRFDPSTKEVRAVADGFTRPNGLCFSPDLATLYITDTGALSGSESVGVELDKPSSIYAFDITQIHGAPFLTNKRLFAYAAGRHPDGIKCDMQGNVYSGCADGVNVWNKSGTLIGNVGVKGGCANFCFGEKGEMFMCNETRFWRVKLNGENVKGALLGL